MLTPEQAEIVKKQLIRHIEKNLPEDRKTFAVQQIMNMGSKELEDFLRKNRKISELYLLLKISSSLTELFGHRFIDFPFFYAFGKISKVIMER
jgi:hypothetical protein